MRPQVFYQTLCVNVTKIKIYGKKKGVVFLEIIDAASCAANTYLIFK